MHFHPDRLVAGLPILEVMAREGLYRSQFETGTSNAGLTAYHGGDRWRWESRIFAGAYDEAVASERPKYGSLNFRLRLVGGSPREAIVLDPSYSGSPVEAMAGRLGCPVQWHGGFMLTATELRRHPEYRGPEFVSLGVSLARGGRLDARIIGDAARTGRYDEQALKRVWHYVARFGSLEMQA